MTTPERPVTVGDVTQSAVAIGDNAHAESHHGSRTAPDPLVAELLSSMRALRADLARLSGDRYQALEAELSETERELARSGRADPSRLRSLRQSLTGSQALVELFTSAGALSGALTAILGA
ncbi:hypothetical protein ACRAR1_04655 [Streptomyces sanyensis]|uniref:hypothetical protein n=1 Tax=Streptomyces sanyensis TaxID=568869 RepID=UPI003D76A813